MVAFVRWVDRLSIACAALAAVMLALAAIVITWSVIYRFFGASTYWEIEFSVYMMVAALFLASPYTLATNGHVGVFASSIPSNRCASLSHRLRVFCLWQTYRHFK